MADLEKMKSSLARYKGHVTRAQKQFKIQMTISDREGVQRSKQTVLERLDRVYNYLMEMEESKDIDQNGLKTEFDDVDIQQNEAEELFQKYLQDLIEGGDTKVEETDHRAEDPQR